MCQELKYNFSYKQKIKTQHFYYKNTNSYCANKKEIQDVNKYLV